MEMPAHYPGGSALPVGAGSCNSPLTIGGSQRDVPGAAFTEQGLQLAFRTLVDCGAGISWRIVCVPMLLLGIVSPVLAQETREINALTVTRNALVGSAYNSQTQLFIGQGCVTGDTRRSGVSLSSFSFEQSLSQQQARKELGFGAGGRASFGIAEASFSARFARSATSSALSVSSVWLSEYRLPSDTLVNPKHSEIGQAVGTNDERWRETCGDRYVNEITRGAKLFVSVRIDFSSEQAKEDFQTKFQLSGPLYSANADLKTASDEFSQDARVRVSAFQIGGDVSKLTAVFGDTTENRASFVQCSLGDFVRCASVVEAVLAYAADTAQGFPSQIAPDSTPGAAPLFYRTSDYTAAAIYPAEYPGLAEAVRLARRSLETSFNREFEREILAERLLAYDLGSDNRRDLAAQREIVQTNIVSMLAASKTCYDTPTACVAATESMELLPVDDTVFILPPLPTADYRILTTRYGLWSREESTAAINADPPEPYVDTSWFPIFPPPPPPPGHDHGFRSLKQVAYPYPLPPMNVKPTAKPVGEASTVLYIRGQALTEAVLYFENNRVQTIPLQPDVGSFPEKTGDGFALVVVETTRSNPGWLDIDIDAEINKLSKEMREGPNRS